MHNMPLKKATVYGFKGCILMAPGVDDAHYLFPNATPLRVSSKRTKMYTERLDVEYCQGCDDGFEAYGKKHQLW